MTAKKRKSRAKGAASAARTDADTFDTREWVGDVANAHRLLGEIGPLSEQLAVWGTVPVAIPYYSFAMAMTGRARRDIRERILDRLVAAVRATGGTAASS